MMLIREMTQEDWVQVSMIYKQGIDSGMATFQQECPSYEEWHDSHLMACRYVAVDTEEDRVVGFVAISATSKRESYKGVVELSVYVHNDYKGKGVGTSLIGHLCIESEKQGFWTLYAAIFAKNKASRALHKKCGFREIGYREKIAKDREGIWQDTILMERRSKNI